ncbi:MAG: formate C-acetyltransferase/glycerol dehydratase family glycyl radical enzyme [Bacteroidota bacterium]
MDRTENTAPTGRISSLKSKTTSHGRSISMEQARIITRIYRDNENLAVPIKRALALAQSLRDLTIHIDQEELIVGNRTPEIRAGVVFPEAGISWLSGELDTLSTRPQDPFRVDEADKKVFLEEIEPYWRERTLEDHIYATYGKELRAIEKVVKINQKDHAQGHICPHVDKWLKHGPAGLLAIAKEKLKRAPAHQQDFYQGVSIALEAATHFINRYGLLAQSMSEQEDDQDMRENLLEIQRICKRLSEDPPSTFREALQSVWFLFVILQMESNASSFSPGRMDQYLYPYFSKDLSEGRISREDAQEVLDALYIKFNQIVYLRNSHSAKYFAGFPIGFNVAIGGQTRDGRDATNLLSYMFLRAQEHIGLPQPNLSARLHKGSPSGFVDECSRVIGLGSGMPQIMNDESIIPALETSGLEHTDAMDYAVVGCVELSSQGNYLGWSDAAMFNLVKVLELTLNDGKCFITGDQMGLDSGTLPDHETMDEFENAFGRQIDYFIGKMMLACDCVEKAHQTYLPSPFLSSVVDDCLEKGLDVTVGGAKYNFSGIQAIQVANIADSMAVLKMLIFEDQRVDRVHLLEVLRKDFVGFENLRMKCIEEVPKYGNDVAWVDEIGARWVNFFNNRIKAYKNYRGGDFQLGLYTVSAHVPMGQNVGATPDGRLAGTPLADGGISPMYGQDIHGPTAVLGSVSRIPSRIAANGTLLNMKFLPSFFHTKRERNKFSSFLKAFVRLPIHHIQFNVVQKEDLLDAKKNPDKYMGLTVRVAGYTAYFIELAGDLQDEIIQRTCQKL